MRFLLVWLLVYSPGFALDFEAFAEALAEVETNNNNSLVGSSGERSAWQFMPSTWKDYTDIPFVEASNNQEAAKMVLQKHVNTLKKYLKVLDLPTDVYHVALIHNAGFGTIKNNKVEARHGDFATRVEQLYKEKNDRR